MSDGTQSAANVRYVPAAQLEHFSAAVFEQVGIKPAQARIAAGVLSYANQRGVDSHGIRNLKPLYIDPLAAGKIGIEAQSMVVHETPVSAVLDGKHSLGLVTAHEAMSMAIDKADQSGLCLITMRNSHHLGAAGYYSAMALQKDMIGICMSGYFFTGGSDYGVLPMFGIEPMLSTNPMSISFPTKAKPPFLLDMATSIAPFNRVLHYKETGQMLPAVWGLDISGQPTQDPAKIRYLFPLGGSREMGGHKGFGLGLMVEILSAVLSGGWGDTSAVTRSTSDHEKKQHSDAHFFAAIRLDLFRPAEEFKQSMDSFIDAIHSAPTAEGHDQIFYPGEIEHITRRQRLAEGVPVPDVVWADLQQMSDQYQVPLTIEI